MEERSAAVLDAYAAEIGLARFLFDLQCNIVKHRFLSQMQYTHSFPGLLVFAASDDDSDKQTALKHFQVAWIVVEAVEQQALVHRAARGVLETVKWTRNTVI